MLVERDVVIAGAGPAGAICAAYLARAGVDVLLLDKDIFPRDKACGDILYEGFVSHINELGVFEKLDSASTCIRNIKLIAGDNEALLPIECYCVPRREVDELLVKTAEKAGAELRQNCFVSGLVKKDGKVKGVKVRQYGLESEVRAKIVIDAGGASGLWELSEKRGGSCFGVRAYYKSINLDRKLASGQYNGYGVFAFGDEFGEDYLWAVPSGRNGVGDGICNVGLMFSDKDAYDENRTEDKKPDKFIDKWINSSPVIREMFDGAERISPWMPAELPSGKTAEAGFGDAFMRIGDAAGCMAPLMKDGMSAAADSARAAAEAAMDALGNEIYTGEFLKTAYGRYSAKVSADDIKYSHLIMESLKDKKTAGLIIRRLTEDKAYMNRVKDEIRVYL